MILIVYQYPRCGTCRKALKYLNEKGIPHEDRHIVENPPSRRELEDLVRKSGLPLTKFFNTSGKKYRELGLKDRLKEMDEAEMLDLLASDGMLIKRPIVTDGKKVTVGFKEEMFDEVWAR
ncbi:arsenate reductase [Kroppenstedtia guangzhouensis]|jgi:arsenate reductase (glutaredoxin)|uniref:Arsenate reductase n=1 Tax=Kroppenstedtia guangzhouensis TaxID=1274356 RepID=A0ABQ1H012_9BACL|nr:arsenate reductase family protein [Kroppenstedtia guangzhouensis]GGA53397.1 arsenate reductase [Kroppenstedtia guangzhouensis]